MTIKRFILRQSLMRIVLSTSVFTGLLLATSKQFDGDEIWMLAHFYTGVVVAESTFFILLNRQLAKYRRELFNKTKYCEDCHK